jgi:2,4-dienoyl-CoA reductase-like NADH-dependent reductase (Old Yellow Enzyme family)
MIHFGASGPVERGAADPGTDRRFTGGRISPNDLGLYSQDNEAALARVLNAIRAYSPIPVAMQLSHAGRKASSRAPWDGGAQIRPDDPSGWKTEAPSAVPHGKSEDAR